ncbi:hypothetical protein SERLADRAFT_370336 [Serpula lacrymans var. lacrymans S7.9]|uniref:Uncharacterized protein n=1 Tax=Serpula lacrymans var. lacrymans (strain S7.9) TaxID=578457 RepID=F8P019_SERL9|nr:uncharacterized protein SERLADRAFT_370336 [Serpula lacrymans var. lacrymans S7.9]EGO23446.1 hypothetical protein SERLADRAFT_370336 [Serpula lacrymans var. lacrymans S7.9]
MSPSKLFQVHTTNSNSLSRRRAKKHQNIRNSASCFTKNDIAVLVGTRQKSRKVKHNARGK